MSTLNITLTPAEAAQVAEKVIEIAESRYGYGEQARSVITEALTEIRGGSLTATMEPGATSLTVEAEPATLSIEVPSLEERVSALEALAKRHLGVDPF